jgi:pyruvate dehydrogenase E2 component (dihydrolipoamide acetyltransferase)
MAEFFVMPQASPTMEAGTLLSWKKPEGSELAPQDVIAEVETDKAAMDIEVFDRGFLLKILAAEGDEIPAGQPIAIIGTAADEDISGLVAEYEANKDKAPAPAAKAPEPPAAKVVPVAAPPAPEPQGEGWTDGEWHGRDINSSIMDQGGWSLPAPLVRASPLARRIANERGIDLASLRGSGPHGRVVRADVEKAPASRGRSVKPPGPDTAVRNSKMRKVIASRLKESFEDNPVFFLTATLECDRLVDFRKQLKAQDIKVSYNDLTVAAVARALSDVPECNATWGDEAITRFGSVDVGVAVALDDGLITPVIRNANNKTLEQLSTETRELVDKARNRKLQPAEYTGAGFSISNLGMMQIEQFTAIINPPGAGILAIGSLQQEPVVVDGALAVGWRMRVTMTCDHRVIDGALGARFLQVVRKYIENPVLLLL